MNTLKINFMSQIKNNQPTGGMIRKFSILNNAIECVHRKRQNKNKVDIVLGDDGLFWVAQSVNVQSWLVEAGYQVHEVEVRWGR